MSDMNRRELHCLKRLAENRMSSDLVAIRKLKKMKLIKVGGSSEALRITITSDGYLALKEATESLPPLGIKQ
jgi:hypothetical protein